ncbi:hypothetical protein [Bacillus sp. Marseille-Q3570]|uniref:hypothetical protein n=1 Tax=Bacillus sp. Marseille-Q3570 TaxID=2963522 RepID=UPI0021B780D5|nr:hypothetical protein [Bacillus sp. Marseille-Q3570]
MTNPDTVSQEIKEAYNFLSEALNLVDSLNRTLVVNDNTLEKRYRYILEEQKEHLIRVVKKLEDNEIETEQLGKDVHVIYYGDEVGNLHLGAWKRQTKWIESEGKEKVEDITEKAVEIKQKLTQAIPGLVRVLGEEHVKYVVPALYRDSC